MSDSQEAKRSKQERMLAQASDPGPGGLWSLSAVQTRLNGGLELPIGARMPVATPLELLHAGIGIGGAPGNEGMWAGDYITSTGMSLEEFGRTYKSLPFDFHGDGTMSYNPSAVQNRFDYTPGSYSSNAMIGIGGALALATAGLAAGAMGGGAAGAGGAAGGTASGATGAIGGMDALLGGAAADFSLVPAGANVGIGGVGTAGQGLAMTGGNAIANTAAGLAAQAGVTLPAAVGGAATGAGLGLQAVNSLGLPLSAAELGAGALGATGMPVPTEAPGLTQAPAPVQNITTPGPLPGTTTVPAGTMTTGAAGTGTSALSQLLKSTLGIDVAPGTLDLIGKGLGLGLGVYGANQQADASKSLADQYMSMGAPYRTSLAQLEANPEGFYKSPLVQGALQQGSDALARSLSAKVGNPILNPTALQEMQNFTTRGLLDAYNNRFSQLAGAGQLGVSQAAPLGVQANQAQGTTYNALGAGIQSVFGNQRDYTGELLDMLRGRQSFGSTSLA